MKVSHSMGVHAMSIALNSAEISVGTFINRSLLNNASQLPIRKATTV